MGLLTLSVAFAAAVALTGARGASLQELQWAIGAGSVDKVRVIGALPPEATGSSQVSIEWQDGWNRHVTTVLQVSTPDEQSSSTMTWDIEPLHGDVERQLRAWDRDGALVVEDGGIRPRWEATVGGWHMPVRLGPVAPLLWVSAVLLLVGGPEPWRATRWAWFWVFSSPLAVVSIPLFAILSGPTRGVRRPSRPERRWTGGWTFIGVTLIGIFFGLAS